VDVVVTVSTGRQDPMTRTVAGNLQVLTAGTRYDQEEARDGKPIPSTVVTLMVLPVDAERIALAQNEGRITLVLRNPLDVAPTDTPGIRLAALLSPPVVRRAAAPAPPPAPAPAPQPAAVYRVETIRAAERNEEVIR
jgi:Flp pilus assembly protein CpaB